MRLSQLYIEHSIILVHCAVLSGAWFHAVAPSTGLGRQE